MTIDLVSVLTNPTSGSTSRFTVTDLEGGTDAFLSSNLVFLAGRLWKLQAISGCRFMGVPDGVVVEVDLSPELPAVLLVGLELFAWRLSFVICCSIAHAVQSVSISFGVNMDLY